MRKRRQLHFEVLLTSHCNLNCAYCANFAPLAPKNFYDVEIFKNECKRISQLTGRKVDSIRFSGGETLLHPNITDFFDISRSYFDKHSEGEGVEISVISNGVLLTDQPETFWKNCKKNDIDIKVTKYPVNLDFDGILKIAKNNDVRLSFFQNTDEVTKSMSFMPLDINGTQNIKVSFGSCFSANECITLSYGRLYTCPRCATIQYFNKYFDKNIEISEMDSIDIYKADSIDEILSFLCKPIPFCRYCDFRKTEFRKPWHISNRKISEWTV
jgi:organic radical activating enzyme